MSSFSPARIAVHNGASILGGQEIWNVRLLSGLRERGHRVLLFCRDRTMKDRFEDLGVHAEVSRIGGQIVLPHAWTFARDLGRARPDALLLATFKKTWLGGMGARMAGVPRVFARIGLSTDLPSRHWTYRVAFRRWIDRTAVNADSIRRDFLREMPGLDPLRVVTLYNGVDPPERRRSDGAVRRELEIPPEAPVVGTVARLTRQKRLDRMLRAAARLPVETHWIVAGGGELEEELRALAVELGIARRVHFLGHRSDVGDVLDALDVYVLTSDREGMSNAMLEAMTVGLPVVSTPVSGASEALDPLPDGREPGRIVEADPASVARAVGELLQDPGRRMRMATAARERARSRFSYEAMLDAWEAFLLGPLDAPLHQGPSPLRQGDREASEAFTRPADRVNFRGP